MTTEIVQKDGKYQVVRGDEVLGTFFTRRGALGCVANNTERTMIAGPWGNAARRMQSAQVMHGHNPLDPESGLTVLTHVHEFDSLDHVHPGYGPGYSVGEEDDEEPSPGGQQV